MWGALDSPQPKERSWGALAYGAFFWGSEFRELVMFRYIGTSVLLVVTIGNKS